MFKRAYQSIRIIFKYAKKITIIKLLHCIFAAVTVPLILYATQKLIDNIFGSFRTISIWVFLLAIAMIYNACLGVVNSYINILYQKKLSEKFSADLLYKFRTVKYECYENSRYNDVIMRMGDRPQENILGIFNNVMDIVTLCITITSLVFLFTQVSLVVAVIYLIIIIIMLFLDFKSMNMMNDMFNNQSLDERQLNYYRELLSDKNSLLELKIFGAVTYIQEKCRIKNKEVLNERLKTTIKSQRYFACSILCIITWIAMVIYILVVSVISNSITIGIFVSLIGSVGTVLSTTESLSFKISNIAQKCYQIGYYEEFMGMPDTEIANKEFENGNQNVIELSHVYFKYPESENYVLNDISLKICLDSTYALVGENGCGKTTLVKLLCRLYKPTKGSITLNGTDIYEFLDVEYLKVISAVFQDFVKYQLTVRENVALGLVSEIDKDDKIKEILKELVEYNNYDNLDENLGKLQEDGRDLSGGEWQKLSIARACYSYSKLVIMDEPTASLDPLAESKLYHTVLNMHSNRGILIISHRMASARFLSHIFVLKEGRLVEEGNHEELMDLHGLYHDMYQAQSSWYTEEGMGDLC